MISGKIDFDQFKISDDGKTLFWVVGDKEIRITAKQGGAEFLSLSTLTNKYNRIVGHGAPWQCGSIRIYQIIEVKPSYPSKSVKPWKAHVMTCET